MASPPPDARGALLGRLIDHAALFPPASLPMDEALAADRRVRAGEHAWIVDRFICPASRLHELHDDPPRLSVVHDGDPTADVRALPVELVEARCAAEAVAETYERIRRLFGHDVRVFLELPLDAPLDQLRAAGVGAKVRCGGEAFPSVGELARFVCGCYAADVPFKATAGLHHALRRDDRHGFLNLLAGAVFAAEGEDRVTALLAEEHAAAFAVGPDGLSAHGLHAGPDHVLAARERLVAYGSCSVDEPVEEMLALGILP